MDSSDVMALPYLLTLPDRELLAVTVTATGVAHCPPGSANARAIAQAVDSDVPTACGPASTIGIANPFPDGWRYPADDLYGINLPLAAASSGGGGAVELLTEVIAASERPVEIVTLGPLTNIAALFEQDPDVAQRIARLVIMGGAVDAPGNVELDAPIGGPEWNIWADPEAARVVFASPVPITLVPLDATDDVPIEVRFLDALEADHAAVGADLSYELLVRNPFLVSATQFFWDQLASVVLEVPEVVTLETMPLVIGDGPDLGRTIRDESGRQVDVAVAADAEGFEEVFLAGLRRGPRADPTFAIDERVAVTWDGEACAHDAPAVTAGATLEITFGDESGAAGLWLAVLREDATWAQLEELAATFRPGDPEPEFVSVLFIPGGGLQIIDAPAGMAGFVCAALVDGEPVALVLSNPFEIGP